MWNFIFKDAVDRCVDERINEILGREELFTFRSLPDKQVRKEMSVFIQDRKKEGITELSTLDFVLGLKIPADKIESMLEVFQKENKVKEIEHA